MSDDKVLERSLSLVQTILNRTRAGRVNWEPSPDFQQGFQAKFGDVRIVIQERFDPDNPDNPDFVLSVVADPPPPAPGTLGALGRIIQPEAPRVIEEISNITLRAVMDRVTVDGLNPYAVLVETFKLARRKALKVDDVIDVLFKKLNEE